MTMIAPEYYVFTGRDGERIPRHITHVRMAKALNFVPARAFEEHPNIQEVICHEGVEKIERMAFYCCPSLRRVIMPGVKEVEEWAFTRCTSFTYVECGKLEIVGRRAFSNCGSLSSIDLPSIMIVETYAFNGCRNLTNVKFGKDLESVGGLAFLCCRSLERIALKLKDGMIAFDDTFQYCKKLNHVDLVEGTTLSETIAGTIFTSLSL